MPARFFVDENDLALGKALARQRDDVVFPGHPHLSEVPRQAPDDRWLQVVGERELVRTAMTAAPSSTGIAGAIHQTSIA